MAGIRSRSSTLMVEWLHDKYSNFVKGKCYTAVARSRFMGRNRLYTDFRITDEDGEYYSLDLEEVGKNFVIRRDYDSRR